MSSIAKHSFDFKSNFLRTILYISGNGFFLATSLPLPIKLKSFFLIVLFNVKKIELILFIVVDVAKPSLILLFFTIIYNTNNTLSRF